MRCAFCHDALGPDGGACPGCGTRLHYDCARAAGRCPTLGCARVARPLAAVWAAAVLPPRWGAVAISAVVLLALGWASQLPFYRALTPSAALGPDALPPLPPGAATPEVLAACRALLAGGPRVYGPADLVALDPVLRRLEPERVVVEAACVRVELDPVSTLVALAEGAHWRDVAPFPEPMAIDELLTGLWLVTPW
ncbi:MAG: hypothetical protein KF878_36480 [Planctomycetes bacterium]|nr:hypothetical protein [Planctomycetota bacterium]